MDLADHQPFVVDALVELDVLPEVKVGIVVHFVLADQLQVHDDRAVDVAAPVRVLDRIQVVRVVPAEAQERKPIRSSSF